MENVTQIVEQARAIASQVTSEFLAKHGDRDCCGFSWISTSVKGNTKLGRALKAAGFRKEYGGGYQLWNPSGHYTQSITAKEEGARAAANFLSEKLGESFYMGSRLD